MPNISAVWCSNCGVSYWSGRDIGHDKNEIVFTGAGHQGDPVMSVASSLQLLNGRWQRLNLAITGRVAPRRAARKVEKMFRTPRRLQRRADELAVLVNARPLRLNFAGLDLAGYEWRPRRLTGDDQPILLMHGWEGRATQFAALIEALLQQGRRVVAFDAPGHGDSPGDESTVGAFADLVLEADHAFGPFHAAIGHSMGGGAIMSAVVRGLRTDRIVSIAAPASLRRAATRSARAMGLPPRALPAFLQAVAHSNGRALETLDFDRLLPPPELDVLLLHDPRDAEVPASESAAVAGVWPNVKLRHITGVGHRRILGADTTQRLILGFLSDHGSQRHAPLHAVAS
jgi:pimeloyl-ACP methyl ester carboxylesterase